MWATLLSITTTLLHHLSSKQPTLHPLPVMSHLTPPHPSPTKNDSLLTPFCPPPPRSLVSQHTGVESMALPYTYPL